MPTIKRRLANLIERFSGNLVIAPHELYQMPERRHLRRLFDRFNVDCVFDVGANAGQYATMLRTAVGFAGPIVSFEPTPALAAQLERDAAADPHWHIVPVALDREAGTGVFNITAGSEFSSLRRPSTNQPRLFAGNNVVVEEVAIVKSTIRAELDRWQARLNFRTPFLKMDTQGNDLAVVEGAGDAINRFIGLQSEISIRRLYDDAPDYIESIQQYQARGFELSAIVPNNDSQFPHLYDMDCIMFRSDAVVSAVPDGVSSSAG